MNDSSQLHKGSTSQAKQVRVVEGQSAAGTNVSDYSVNTNMTASNPPIPHDTIHDRERSSDSNTCSTIVNASVSSLESPKKGTKRKSHMDVSSHSGADAVVNDTTDTTSTNINTNTTDYSDNTLEKSTGRWTIPEHEAFIRGLSLYGREWKRVAQIIPTRTAAQVRSHAQKYFQHLEQGQQRQLLQQQQQQQQQQDPMIHHKLHENDAFDFNFSSQSYDGNHIPNVDDDVSMTFDHNNNNHRITTTSLLRNTTTIMTDSVREQAIRIMANPNSVHEEVNVTLQQLRQRYRELQNRLAIIQQQQQQSQQPSPIRTNNHHSHCSTSNEQIMDVATTTSSRNHSEEIVTSTPDRNLDEQIVVQVLQARLQQPQPPSHHQAMSSPSIPEYMENPFQLHHHSNNDNHHQHFAEEHPSDYDGDIETDTDEMNIE